MATMELTKENFEQTVSDNPIVIVDFWAPWCGPCKTLQPTIEKVVKEAKGAVKLVKINIDQNQMLAQQLRIQSIPAVYAFFGGRPVDGFMGAVPESQVKQFVDRLVQAAGGAPGAEGGADDLAAALEHAKQAIAENDYSLAAQIYNELIEVAPDNIAAIAGLAKCHLQAGNADQAKSLLGKVPAKDKNNAEVVALLASGKNVVTPVGWIYPDLDSCGAILEACERGGTTLHGTGIHPGGITERFPLMVSALSASVTHVRAEEFSDIRTYNAPDVVRHIMGFGVSPEEAMAGPIVGLLGAGFKASVRMIVAEMGFDAEPELLTEQEIAVATAPIEAPVGVIEPGQVAARRFHWSAVVDGVPVVTASVNWLMGDEHLDPAWDFGPAGERFEVQISGDPDVLLTFKGLQPETIEEGLVRNPGIVVTANHYFLDAAGGVIVLVAAGWILHTVDRRRATAVVIPADAPTGA